MSAFSIQTDILIIILDEMSVIEDIHNIMLVNREFRDILYERNIKEREKYERKTSFIKNCGYPSEKWFGKAFTAIKTIEECKFVEEEYVKRFKDDFSSRIRYMIFNIPILSVVNSWKQYQETRTKSVLV